jgi:hypothetical protein
MRKTNMKNTTNQDNTITDTKELLSPIKAGMTTGSRKQTYNGFADSARRMTNFRSGHEETRKGLLRAVLG